jgi:carboxyl-terminal processing protease
MSINAKKLKLMKILVILLFPLSIASYLLGFETNSLFFKETSDTVKVLAPAKNHRQVQELAVTILDRFHYRKATINDSLSSVMFDRYLQNLDPGKLYFLQSDIQNFEKYRYKFDDFLKEGNLKPAFEIFNTFRKNVFERNKYILALLENEFDYTKDEYLQVDRKNEPWPATKEEADEIWRKIIKDQALTQKMNDREWKEISESLTRRYQNLQRSIAQLESEDVFQFYINALAETYDPHTSYFSPKASDNFRISMSQSLEGIGARLQMDNEYVKVMEVIPGGPAFKSKLLQNGDRIIGVAQGDDGEMVDVIGWRLDDVVQLIRGAKGTKVRLSVIPAELGINGAPVTISLVRDKVKLEEQAPQKQILSYKQGDKNYRIAVISIPAFYMDFEQMQQGIEDYNSTTRDVRKLLAELENDKVDGLIVDLRNNGGGSLTEAIELTGLFVQDGPIVQVRNANGSIDIANDPNPGISYKGPLAVMVNRFSASASEIFAGAIQDYKRGIIIGEQTFGKGTVQNLVDLNRYMGNPNANFGQMKITLAKFYRINGSSTQHKGVIPDILLPSAFDPDEFGESSLSHALPWDQISPTRYKEYDFITKDVIAGLKKNHNNRMKNDNDFKELIKDIEQMKKDRQRGKVSLQEEKRLQDRREAEESKKTRLKLIGGFEDEDEEESELKVEQDTKPRNASEVKDAYLKESLNVMVDMLRSKVSWAVK